MDNNTIIVSKEKLVELYTDYILSYGEQPKSVFTFAKENGFEEATFYKYFGSFDAIESNVFSMLFESTIAVLVTSEEYLNYNAKDKLLAFYYTFFENLTANRSLVKYLLESDQPNFKNLKKLNGLRSEFKSFIENLKIDTIDLKGEKLNNFQNKAMEEGAWAQLLITLKFWLDDDSPSFERTDVFIEKSVNTSFELMNVQPLKSLFDLGKFVFQERAGLFNKNAK